MYPVKQSAAVIKVKDNGLGMLGVSTAEHRRLSTERRNSYLQVQATAPPRRTSFLIDFETKNGNGDGSNSSSSSGSRINGGSGAAGAAGAGAENMARLALSGGSGGEEGREGGRQSAATSTAPVAAAQVKFAYQHDILNADINEGVEICMPRRFMRYALYMSCMPIYPPCTQYTVS